MIAVFYFIVMTNFKVLLVGMCYCNVSLLSWLVAFNVLNTKIDLFILF